MYFFVSFCCAAKCRLSVKGTKSLNSLFQQSQTVVVTTETNVCDVSEKEQSLSRYSLH